MWSISYTKGVRGVIGDVSGIAERRRMELEHKAERASHQLQEIKSSAPEESILLLQVVHREQSPDRNYASMDGTAQRARRRSGGAANSR